LAMDPQQRPQDVDSFRDLLAGRSLPSVRRDGDPMTQSWSPAPAGSPASAVAAAPPAAPYPPPSRRGGSRAMLIIGGTLLVVLLAGAGSYLLLGQRWQAGSGAAPSLATEAQTQEAERLRALREEMEATTAELRRQAETAAREREEIERRRAEQAAEEREAAERRAAEERLAALAREREAEEARLRGLREAREAEERALAAARARVDNPTAGAYSTPAPARGTGLYPPEFAGHTRPSWCHAAKTAIERSICANAGAARADAVMGAVYQELRQGLSSGRFAPIKQEQRDWLKRRNSRCASASAACLEDITEQRLADLLAQRQALLGR